MSESKYYYLRDGERTGPISFAELKSLADGGGLLPDDVVWREGTPDWVPAATVEGLFPQEAVTAQAITDSVAEGVAAGVAGSVADGVAAAMARRRAAAAASAPPPGGSDWREQFGKVRPILERYGRLLELDFLTLVAALCGAAALGLLVLTTLLVWDRAFAEMPAFGEAFASGEATRGMGVLEGKLVFLFASAALVFLGASAVLKRILPIGFLVAGAAATASFFLVWTRRSQVARTIASLIAEKEAADRLIGGENPFAPTYSGGATFTLYFALFLALVAAAAFIFAALRKPQEMAKLREAGGGPLVQKYGLLIGAQALAVLFGLAMYVIRY